MLCQIWAGTGDNLRNHLKDQEDNIEVFESSHLGGHRFAPIMIDFPSGRAYGQLTTEKFPDYFESRKQGMVYAPAYRGSVFFLSLCRLLKLMCKDLDPVINGIIRLK